MKRKRKVVFLAILVLLITSSFIYYYSSNVNSEYVFETVKVEKGSVSNTITATGTLEATNTVVVGTQVSGVIENLYVDFNSIVKKGQLIAELDKSTLLSSLETAEADLDKAKAELEYQEASFLRNKALYEKEMLAKSDYDQSVYTYKLSKASVKSAKANVERAERNLSYATIYSPIDGVVLNRAVEEGQTVAASMNTPELFTITNDLSTMQVEANVDEADIGMVKVSQHVEFTVDAFPDETFSGKVSEVRLQPTETSNVVTYTVIVTVENPELKLKPGMTASITNYVEQADDVLVMAGKAIRFKPERELMLSYMNSLPEDQRPQRRKLDNSSKNNLDGDKMKQRPSRIENKDDNHKMVWIKDGNLIKPVPVEIGINDGSFVQIISGLELGDVIVTSMKRGSSGDINNDNTDEKITNPFVQERKGGRGSRG